MGTIRKGEITKKHIIEQSAKLMNQHGFLSTSLSEIVEATGMQKGGLYNHFKDKEELALQAFDYCCDSIGQYLEESIRLKSSAEDRILAYIEAYLSFTENPRMPGGCPIMNATIEADDGRSEKLLDRAQSAMRVFIQSLEDEIAKGIQNGEIRSDTDPRKTATMMMATTEGGILLSKMFTDLSYIAMIKGQLNQYVKNELCLR
ncbi:TetR/AcrR family transcriptional regulator [Cohnella lupini]|uniref:TetR family transcriptional regulator n=1 Tax=Cohnella lupini TaxID=1294267 RepID=A0A3D9IBZ6_9BACL|nr:TetR/AcrR family transcriptional regulator [Cohnella lupini]RED59298.1 TetR family transcriptional regulator [Cohnella lupini]